MDIFLQRTRRLFLVNMRVIFPNNNCDSATCQIRGGACDDACRGHILFEVLCVTFLLRCFPFLRGDLCDFPPTLLSAFNWSCLAEIPVFQLTQSPFGRSALWSALLESELSIGRFPWPDLFIPTHVFLLIATGSSCQRVKLNRNEILFY